ncbi:polysaccharide biosynthesis/export family protein [Desulfomonile tiedjei]|uniref:Periplasmic protein involved in polysaccharide export n=1 Tax=Desulfomonile tiedjei (strain ATCC 49306 / DSM 6799 / DCB-1) TaxID=706587 RepID=I4C6X7_DESTA|nr:polysaccharide biosynthesis/export family protein [Desulfomonile tiedjei]AFM25318.1 periplasmic protein involved in polysaccharide export [Desulfomonile tiedjei DSM 6799]
MYNYKRLSRITHVAMVGILCILLSSCIGLMPSPFRPSPGPQKTPQVTDLAEAFDIVCRNYRLGPDDQLSLLFQPQWSVPPGSFKLDTLDQIKVKFILDPQLNEDVIIRPDGMITLQAIGDVRAAGLSPQELAKRIEEKFLETNIFSKDDARGELKDYQLVTVHVVSFYEKVNKLVQSLTTLTAGSQKQIVVKPDGTIDLPLLKDRVMCAGYTVREVENTVNRLYRESVLEHAVASLSLQQANSRRVYIMGEVRNPGAYQVTQPITALHALALAGGHISDSADLTSVILISKNIYGKPIGRRLDLKKILDVGDMSSAILVKPYDVLFVPKTYVRDLRIFMEQYITTISEFTNLVNTLGGTSTSN